MCCGINEVYSAETLQCECQTGFYNISNLCQACPPSTVYEPINMTCIIPTDIPGNETTNLGNCTGLNEVLDNGECKCNNRSIYMMDVSTNQTSCVFCGDGMYPSEDQKFCQNCRDKCNICYNNQTCEVCNLGYTGSFCNSCAPDYIRIQGFCTLNPCGNGRIDAGETCDDGNRKDADGCSRLCSIENGYYCSIVNNSNVCDQVFTLDNDKVTSAGVFQTYDLDSEEAVQDLQAPVVLNGPQPADVKKVVDPNDPTKVRYFLDYCGNLPPENITTFTHLPGATPANYQLEYDLINKERV